MTEHQFDNEIKRLMRRAELLRRVKLGDVKLKRVPVIGHWVRRHYINPYTRLIDGGTR